MKIDFVYPPISADNYIDAVEDFNKDIGNDNLKTALPRIVGSVQRVLFFLLYFIFFWYVLRIYVYVITACERDVIIISMLLLITAFLIGLVLVTLVSGYLKMIIILLMRSHGIMESYSFSEYVERRSRNKKKNKELTLYNMCDTLKRSKILDATARCDGDICKVDIQYSNSSGREVLSFNFPYKISDSTQSIVVDFNRELVIIPESAMEEDTK